MDIRWIIFSVEYPVMLVLGKLIPALKDVFESHIVESNNRAVELVVKNKTFHTVLVLLPHCLQNDKCPHRITYDVANCKNCGNCKIGALRVLAEKYKVSLKVATGGGLARKWVKEVRPDIIVAVACENELADGIAAVYPFLVYAVPNTKPNGPCINTDVAVDAVSSVLQKLVGK
ncbi:MAG: DUF116 domain-containing protein [Elusimicrobiota bacterium]